MSAMKALPVVNHANRTLYVDPEDHRGIELSKKSGDLNPSSTTMWRIATQVKDWDLVVDVGANYGEMITNVDLSHISGEIIAFEPNKRLIPYLSQTIAQLPWEVKVEQMGLSNADDDERIFHVDNHWSGTSGFGNESILTIRGHDVSSVPVRTKTIDSYFNDSNAATMCIKIDVEGSEADVIKGGDNTFNSFDEILVMVEILHMNIDFVTRLARKHPMFLLDSAQNSLIRIEPKNAMELGSLLFSGRVSRQDALFVFGKNTRALVEKLETDAAKKRSVKRVVYTALIGDYETLQEQPMALESDVAFVCLTDSHSLVSETWQVQLIEPAFPADPRRSARLLKIIGHPLLDEYEELLWIDNRVTLRQDPHLIFDEMLGNADLGLIYHSFRDRVADEFDAVIANGYDNPARIEEQREHYRKIASNVLDEKPIWTGMFARRSNEPTKKIMRSWMGDILRYSGRDQLSINQALFQSGLSIRLFKENNRSSAWHVWPAKSVALGRKPVIRRETVACIDRVELSDLSTQLDEINQIYEMERMRAREHIHSVEEKLAKAQGEIPILVESLENLGDTLSRTAAELLQVQKELKKIKKSRTYRFALKLQTMKNKIRHGMRA